MLQFLTYLFIAIYTATVIGIILVVILGNRNPLKTIPWVVVLIFAPVVGLVFYFFFGQELRRKRIISRRTYKRLMVYALPAHVRRSDAPVPAACQSLSTLLTNTSQAVSFYGSRLTHYGDGASKMTALLDVTEAFAVARYQSQFFDERDKTHALAFKAGFFHLSGRYIFHISRSCDERY